MKAGRFYLILAAAALLGFGESCTQKTAVAKTDNTGVETPKAPPASQMDGSALAFDPQVRRGTLANGMQYFIRPNTRPTDRAELRLMVKAGSILEDPDQQGLAHFVEHMAFNGTENYAENELIDYLQSTGAKFGPDLNAYTSFDETVYMLQVRTDSAEMLDKGLGILRDWAGGITFADVEIDKERGVVLSEWRSGLGAQERMRNKTLPVLFANSRYAERLPIGDTTVLKRAPYDALKRFYRDWYRPDLMAVAVVGDVEPKEIEAQIKKLFGDLENPNDARPRTEYKGPSYDKTQVVIASDPEANFTLVQTNYLLPEAKLISEQDYRDQLMAELYNTMLGARFSEKGEDPKTPYSFARSGRGGLIGNVDSYSSIAVAKPGEALATLKTVIEENRRVLQHGFTEGEFARAKTNLLNDARTAAREAATKPSGAYARQLVESFLETVPTLDADTELRLTEKYLSTIKLREVNGLAKEFLADRPRAVVITGSSNDKLPTEMEVQTALAQADAMQVTAYADKALGSIEIPPLRPVSIKSTTIFDTNQVTLVTLSNGVRLAYKATKFSDNEIAFSAVSKGGSTQFKDSDYPNADVAEALGGAMGTGPFKPSEMEKVLAGKTVSLSAGIGQNEERLRGQATPETLRDLMELIYLHFQGAKFDEALGQAMLDQQRAFIENLAANPNYRFQKEINDALYGADNPRHRLPSPEMLRQVEAKKGYELYRNRFQEARDWQFNFVGDFNPDTLVYYAQRYLGNLPSVGMPDVPRDPGDVMRRGVIDKRFRAGSAPKSSILLLRAGEFKDSERERLLFRTMTDVISEELRDKLREDMGGVYGVRVSGNTETQPRPEYSLQISFNADPPRVDDLLAATQEVIDRIASQGPFEKTLPIVRTTQYEGLKSAMANSNRFWIPVLERAYTLDRNVDEVNTERMRKMLDSISASDISAAVRKYFNQDALTKMQIVMDPEG